MNSNSMVFFREVYSGSEYIESSLYDINNKYLVRVIPKKFIDSFLDFVVHVNQFTHIPNTFLPTTVESKGENIIVKFKYFNEKPLTEIIDKLSEEDLNEIVKELLNYLYGVINGIYPPVPCISLDDIFVYAGQFFFLPPLIQSKNVLSKILKKSNVNSLFVAPEFLKEGVCNDKSTFYAIGKFIQTLDKDKKYESLTENLTLDDPEKRNITPELIDKLVTYNRNLVREIEPIIRDKISETRQHYHTIEIHGASYNEFKSILGAIYKEFARLESSLFICVEDDFTNIPRQLLAKYKHLLNPDELEILYPTLYANTKFNSILPVLIGVLNRAKFVFLCVEDVDNGDYLIRTFLSHLRTIRMESKIIVITRNSSRPDVKLTVKNISQKYKCNKITNGKEKILAVLGQRFKQLEMILLEKITNEDLEKYLKRYLKRGIISKEGNEYVFDENVWNSIYNQIPLEERVSLHLSLAKKLVSLSDPFNLSLLKSSFHYIMAGKEISAVIVCLKFVKKNLETYTFSTERMKDALFSAYEILKKHNRIDSYAFNSILLRFRYQSLEELDNIVLSLPEGKINNFLILLENFVNENHKQVIVEFERSFEKPYIWSAKRRNFKQLKAYLLYQYSYYNLNDTIEDKDFLKDLFENIPEINNEWTKLKSEYILLYILFLIYKNRSEAIKYAEKAKQLIEKSGAKYLMIRLENAVGTLNDMAAISIENFKRAIQISLEIGYSKRSLVPYVNLLRSLLYFGFIEELKEEIKKTQGYVSLWRNASDLAFYYRILAFLPMYEQKHDEADESLKRALDFERSNNLQQASLRGIILNELLCGNFEAAKKVALENIDNPAVKTRAFEYLIEMLLAKDDEEFKNVWIEYRNSPYHLLREEILYIFSDRISELDEEGFLKEIRAWEDTYTSGGVNLSLFYILLAKYRYLERKGNKVRSEFIRSEICNLAEIMKSFQHPFLYKCSSADVGGVNSILHTLKRLDLNVSLSNFVKLFASEIYRLFKAQRFSIGIFDSFSNISYEMSNTNKIPENEVFNLHPFELLIKDRIDEYSYYHIYIYSEELAFPKEESLEDIITLVEELFTGQLKGIIFRERASIDSLTGLYNRWKLNQLIDEKLDKKTDVFSIFIMDIDDFKKINDSYGHIVGDKVLIEIANLLKNLNVNDNVVARYGGEEFVGLICSKKAVALKICKEIKSLIAKTMNDKFGFEVTVSIGIADSTEKNTRSELLGLADQRLYEAKNSGKNTIVTD
ncbi:MAG: GGDEF domain-containing protein [Fervidobacterium sp.]|nr:GGDEF domain-containing protein [Fervidobacterium sp.]